MPFLPIGIQEEAILASQSAAHAGARCPKTQAPLERRGCRACVSAVAPALHQAAASALETGSTLRSGFHQAVAAHTITGHHGWSASLSVGPSHGVSQLARGGGQVL